MASFDDNMLLSDRLRMACRQCRACQTLQPTTTRVNFLLLYSRYGGKTPDGYARWVVFASAVGTQRRRTPKRGVALGHIPSNLPHI
jgi:hypothetical protein